MKTKIRIARACAANLNGIPTEGPMMGQVFVGVFRPVGNPNNHKDSEGCIEIDTEEGTWAFPDDAVKLMEKELSEYNGIKPGDTVFLKHPFVHTDDGRIVYNSAQSINVGSIIEEHFLGRITQWIVPEGASDWIPVDNVRKG